MLAAEEINKIVQLISNEEERRKVELELYKNDFSSKDEFAADLYKVEYEQAAERYENIYKAVWTNFSYMSLVAGGILTFGGNILGDPVFTAFLACIPLLFWYVVTFVPMNTYGDRAVERLAQIEALVNDKYGTRLDHFSSFNRRRYRVWHILTRPSVRFAMLLFFVILALTAATFFMQTFFNSSPLLRITDLKNPKALVQRLQADNEQDKVARFLQQKLSAATGKAVTEYNPDSPPQSQLHNQFLRNLVADLNRIIEGEVIYKDELFKGVATPHNIKDQIKEAKTGADFLRLNRVLIDQTFPSEIYPYGLQSGWLPVRLPLILGITISIIFGLTFIFELYEQIRKSKGNNQWERIRIISIDHRDKNKPTVDLITVKTLDDVTKLGEKNFAKISEISSIEWMKPDERCEVIALDERSGRAKPVLLTVKDMQEILEKKKM